MPNLDFIPRWLMESLVIFSLTAIGTVLIRGFWSIGRRLFPRRAPSKHFEPLLKQIAGATTSSSTDRALILQCGGRMVLPHDKTPFFECVGRVEDHLTKRELREVHRAARRKLAELHAVAREKEGRNLLSLLTMTGKT